MTTASVQDSVLGRTDRERVVAAIRAAEAATSGEVYCVVARRSGSYAWIIHLACALVALVSPVALVLADVQPGPVWHTLTGGWTVAHDGRTDGLGAGAVVMIVAMQLGVFGLLALLLGWPAVADRISLLRGLRREAVHKAALDQFSAHGIAETEGRTGVLIYVSLAEHIAEIVADQGIHGRVDPSAWSAIAADLALSARNRALADGLAAAVTASGTLLAAHFPPSATNEDELPDRVVII